jgi:hypothetical protein
MALFIRQDENRTELQKRLAAELQDRAKKNSKLTDRPDGVDDSQYIEGTKKTTSLAWAWLLIIIMTVGIIIWLMVISMAG